MAHAAPLQLECVFSGTTADKTTGRNHVWWLLPDSGADKTYKPYHRRAAELGHICNTIRHELTQVWSWRLLACLFVHLACVLACQ